MRVAPGYARAPSGDFAIRNGHFRFETDTMVFAIAVIVLLVQAEQFSGSRIARPIDRR